MGIILLSMYALEIIVFPRPYECFSAPSLIPNNDSGVAAGLLPLNVHQIPILELQ